MVATMDTTAAAAAAAAAEPPTVVFRGKTSSLRKLRHTLAKTCQVIVGDDAASDSDNANASVIVVCGDANSVSSDEAEQHLASGGSILFLLSGTSSSHQVPVFLRKVVGITVNEDTVVGLSHNTGADGLHPRHVRIVAIGAAHTDIIDAGVRSIVYPEGITLRFAQNSTAVTILSSGPETFPTNRPIAMAWEQPSTGGRVVAVGSSSIFSDGFLKKEGNGQMCNAIFQYLLKSTDQITFKVMTASCSITIEDDQSRPDIAALANRIKPCLGRLDPLPQGLTEMYCDDNLFGFDTDTVSDLYQAMDVPREPLQLIQPEFQIVMPPLRPAVFSPQIELPPPTLELFNLDEECTDRHTKLGQLTNECLNEGTSAEEFVQRAGAILGVAGDPGKVPPNNGKAVLSRIFGRIVDAQIGAEDRLPVLHVDTRAF